MGVFGASAIRLVRRWLCMNANPDLSTRLFQHAGVVNTPAIFVGDIPGSYALFHAPVTLDLAAVLYHWVRPAMAMAMGDPMADGPPNRRTGNGQSSLAMAATELMTHDAADDGAENGRCDFMGLMSPDLFFPADLLIYRIAHGFIDRACRNHPGVVIARLLVACPCRQAN